MIPHSCQFDYRNHFTNKILKHQTFFNFSVYVVLLRKFSLFWHLEIRSKIWKREHFLAFFFFKHPVIQLQQFLYERFQIY